MRIAAVLVINPSCWIRELLIGIRLSFVLTVSQSSFLFPLFEDSHPAKRQNALFASAFLIINEIGHSS